MKTRFFKHAFFSRGIKRLPLLATFIFILCGWSSVLHAQTIFYWNKTTTNNPNWSMLDAANWGDGTGTAPNSSTAIADMRIGYTGNMTTSIGGTQTLAGLIIGNTDYKIGVNEYSQKITAGGSSNKIQLQSTIPDQTPYIRKETGSVLGISRNINFLSNGDIIITGGSIRFESNDMLTFSSGITVTLKGGLNENNEWSSGIMVIATDKEQSTALGTLLISTDGVLSVNGSYTAGIIQVGSEGTLGGKGTIASETAIKSGGILSSGDLEIAAGRYAVQTFSGDLTLEEDATYRFELGANANNQRGAKADGVNITGTGSLTLEDGVQFDMVLNASGSTVDFTNAFWENNQEWLVFQSDDTTILGTSPFTLGTLTTDSLGQSMDPSRFAFRVDTGDIYLTYTIPEPSSVLLLIGSTLFLFMATKKRLSAQS